MVTQSKAISDATQNIRRDGHPYEWVPIIRKIFKNARIEADVAQLTSVALLTATIKSFHLHSSVEDITTIVSKASLGKSALVKVPQPIFESNLVPMKRFPPKVTKSMTIPI